MEVPTSAQAAQQKTHRGQIEAEPVPQWSNRNTPRGGGLPLGLYLGHLEALTPAIRGSLYKSPHLQTHFAQHPMRVLEEGPVE